MSTDQIHPLPVLIVEDHPLFRNALKNLVDGIDGCVTVSVNCAEQAVDYLKESEVRLILLDMMLPGLSGIPALIQIRQVVPRVPILVLSANEELKGNALDCGASSFLSKSAHNLEILKEIRQMLGHPEIRVVKLTLRQEEVLNLLCRGMSNKEIGNALELTDTTVKMHISFLFRIFGVKSRTQLVLLAQQLDHD